MFLKSKRLLLEKEKIFFIQLPHVQIYPKRRGDLKRAFKTFRHRDTEAKAADDDVFISFLAISLV